MGNKFEGLVLFLIGLTEMLVAGAISGAETKELVQLSSTHWSVVGIRAPYVDALGWLGLVLIFTGIIWGVAIPWVRAPLHQKQAPR